MNAPAASASSAFVLVHGAWHGAWCWRRVLPLLRAAGVEAHAVTLTGVGERAHLMGPGIDLNTHIQDVIGLIEAEELQRVVLVGHSYGGIVITGVGGTGVVTIGQLRPGRPVIRLALLRSPSLAASIVLLTGLGAVMDAEKPDVVVVQGDTATAMCGALAAYDEVHANKVMDLICQAGVSISNGMMLKRTVASSPLRRVYASSSSSSTSTRDRCFGSRTRWRSCNSITI